MKTIILQSPSGTLKRLSSVAHALLLIENSGYRFLAYGWTTQGTRERRQAPEDRM